MTFVLGKIYAAVVVPSTLLLLSIIVGLVLLLATRRKWGLTLVALGTLGFVLFPALRLGERALAPLEDRFPVPPFPERVDGILVLGDSMHAGLSNARDRPVLTSNGQPMMVASIFAHRFPEARLVLSAGSGALFASGRSEGFWMKQLMVEDGIDPDRIVVQDRSRNTCDDASFAYSLVQPRRDQVWVMIVMSWHMPRSVACARHAGWSVIPYPAGYETTGTASISIAPSFDPMIELAHFDMAMHEWVGLLTYRVLGKTDEIFPAP